MQLRLQGQTLDAVVRATGLSAPTIIGSVKAFKSGGWAAVVVQPRRGRPPRQMAVFSPQLESSLLQTMLASHAPPPLLAADAEAWLRAHRWPGNLRELRNVLDYAAAMCRDGRITAADLPDALLAGAEPAHAGLPPEAQLLLQYLRAARWNVSAVAHQMGLSRMTLYRRMKRWHIEPPNRRDGD